MFGDMRREQKMFPYGIYGSNINYNLCVTTLKERLSPKMNLRFFAS